MMTETVVTVENNSAKPATESQNALSWLKINVDYWKTVPGFLKIAQLILGILCMALASPAVISATHFFLFVATTAFLATLIWAIVYTLGIREALNLPINWLFTELLNTGIITILYFIAFIVQLADWSKIISSWRGSNIAAGSFGLFNFIAYAMGCYFLYIEWKNNTNQ